MSELRPGFIRVPRIGGEKPCLVRVDQITAILENEVKLKGQEEPQAFRLIQVGPHLSVKTDLTEAEILSRMRQAGATSTIAVVPGSVEEA